MDYISSSLIVILEKYNLNEEPKFINENILKEEINKTISLMSNEININIV